MATDYREALPTQTVSILPGEATIQLILQIVLEAMQGQTPEQKKIMWDWYIEDMKFWRGVFKIGGQP